MAKILYQNPLLKAPVTLPEHLTNKEYVDAAISRKIKEPVRYVCTVDLSSTDYDYDSTDLTLTQKAGSEAAFEFDGETPAEGDRILLVAQDDATQNGIYVVTTQGDDTTPTAGVLTRAEDFDASQKIYPNVIIPVMEGNTQKDITWQLVNNTQPTLDTTELVFGAYKDPAATTVFTDTFEVQTDDLEWTITHGMNSKNVLVQVYNADGEECMFGIKKDTDNTVKILADVTPTVGDVFTVIVVG